MTNPAVHPRPDKDTDVAIADDEKQALKEGRERPGPEPSVDPKNLEHPEELGGE
jgi:hypothetical protein